MDDMTPTDVAFEVFVGSSHRGRMSTEEKALYDYHKDRGPTWDEISEKIRDYRQKESK